MEYGISEAKHNDRATMEKVRKLLADEQLSLDAHIDYTAVVRDDDFNIIGTGSCFENTLRCMAVSKSHQGEGILNLIVQHLCEIQSGRGNSHLFLYTKKNSAKFFETLGFGRISETTDKLVFMENKKDGFMKYMESLRASASPTSASAAIVMNANPFTLGHLHLVETAAREYRTVHIFVVSEEKGMISASDRKTLVERGCAHLPNVICHDCGSYMISTATFPGYFLGGDDEKIKVQAELDANMFVAIAKKTGIACRYMGQEPLSHTTAIYNDIIEKTLPLQGIEVKIIPRKEAVGNPISASRVRALISAGNIEGIKDLVPPATYDFFASWHPQR